MDINTDHIIVRILSGEASSEDYLALTNWLSENKNNKKEFALLKSYWDAEVSFSNKLNPILSLESIRKEINRNEMANKRKQMWRTLIPFAAAIMLFAVISGIYLYNRQNDIHEYFTYLTNDNKTRFTLNDGTEITLNKNSRLTYTNAFGIENRQVKLDGEAYFEVTKDTENPFEVAMEVGGADASIKVLGTVFNVQINADEEKVIATLLEGSIQFQTPAKNIIMTPNQQLVYSYAGNNIQVKTVNAQEEVAWKDGLIRYRSIAFTNLIAELEKKYNVKIIVQNKKLTTSSVTVTGTFTDEQSLEQILEVVSRSLPIKWSNEGETYYIK